MALIDYGVHINLAQNELQNAVIQNLASAPGTPLAGQIYFDSTSGDDKGYIYSGTTWLPFGLKNGDKGDITVSTTTYAGDTWTIDDSAIPSKTALASGLISTDEFFISDGGVLKKMAVSVLEAYMQANLAFGGTYTFDAGADVNADQTINSGDLLEFVSSGPIETTITKVSTTTSIDFAISNASLTNALLATMAANTVKANATAGVASPSDVAIGANQVLGRLAANIVAIDIIDDDTMATATASNLSTAESIKAYVDNAVVGGMTYLGAFDPTAAAGAGSPDLDSITSTTGDTYTVTVAGTYTWTTGSAVLEVGDMLIAEADGVLNDVANWTIVNRNIDITVDTYTATIGNGVLTTIPVTHNLGNQHVVAQVFRESDDHMIMCEIVNTDANTTTFNFNTAPTTDQYRVNIVG